MTDLEAYPSDSSDDDYVPGADSGDEDVSDVEEKNSESCESGEENENRRASKSKKRKLIQPNGIKARKRKGGIKLENETEKQLVENPGMDDCESSANTDSKSGNGEKEKERADALWASFMQDVELKPKPSLVKPSSSPSIPATSNNNYVISSNESKSNKVTITKVYDFAGEEIRVSEQVDVNSKEARLAEVQNPQPDESNHDIRKTAMNTRPATNIKPAGLSSVLNKISGKKRMSTLDKSLLDWKDFKDQEGIDEELKTFNKGKEGYLERQAFLQRADLRQFEVEKTLRQANRSNR